MRTIIREDQPASEEQRNYIHELLRQYGRGFDHALGRMRDDLGLDIEFDPIRGLSHAQAGQVIDYLKVYNSVFRGVYYSQLPQLQPYQPEELPW